MNTRKTLVDLYREAGSGLVPRVPFAQAYPEIESISVEINNAVLEEVSPKVPCGHPKCYGGGLHLDEIIRAIVEKRKTVEEVVRHCVGYESSPKGRRIYGPCSRRFQVQISIRYTERAAEAP